MSEEAEKKVVCFICQQPVLLAERWWTKCNCKLEIHRKCIAIWQIESDVCVACPSCKIDWYNPLDYAHNKEFPLLLVELMHYQAVRLALAQSGYLTDPERPPSASECPEVNGALLRVRAELASNAAFLCSDKWLQECEVLSAHIRRALARLSSEYNTHNELHEPQLPLTVIYARHLARARSIGLRLVFLIWTTRTLNFFLRSVMSLNEDLAYLLHLSVAALKVMEGVPQLLQQVQEIWDELNGPLEEAYKRAKERCDVLFPEGSDSDELDLDYVERLARRSTGSLSPLPSPPLPLSPPFFSEDLVESGIALFKATQKREMSYRNASATGAEFMVRIAEFDRLLGDIIGRVQGCDTFLAGLDIASLWPDEN